MPTSKLRYGISEIASNGRDRSWWRGRIRERVLRPYFERTHSSPDPKIPDADWDTLILLDACRYDLFEETATDLPGELYCRVSHASATPGYLEANYAGEMFHDVVYVTANPFVNTELPKGTFHDVVPVWQEGWDEELGTVPPESVLDAVREAVETYHDKRIVAHFCQPHFPFIGDVEVGDCSMAALRNRAAGNGTAASHGEEVTPFDLLQRGDATREEVWEAYRSNLERVLPTVETLLDELEGRTVVTADHGNALGEFATPFPVRVYGHPRGIRVPATVQVPWLVHETGERRETTADPPTEQQTEAPSVTRERLQSLGYAK